MNKYLQFFRLTTPYFFPTSIARQIDEEHVWDENLKGHAKRNEKGIHPEEAEQEAIPSATKNLVSAHYICQSSKMIVSTH